MNCRLKISTTFFLAKRLLSVSNALLFQMYVNANDICEELNIWNFRTVLHVMYFGVLKTTVDMQNFSVSLSPFRFHVELFLLTK